MDQRCTLFCDVWNVPSELLANAESLANVLSWVTEGIGMRAVTPPSVVPVTTEMWPVTGYSGFVIVKTSHVSLHTWAENRRVAIEIVSCEAFDSKRACSIICESFQSQTVTALYQVQQVYPPAES